LSDFFGTTLLEQPLKIITPQLQILQANYSQELEIHKRAKLDLVNFANLIKQDKQAYPLLAHLMVNS